MPEILLSIKLEHLRLGYKALLDMEGHNTYLSPEDNSKKEYDIVIVHGGAIPDVDYKYLIRIEDLVHITPVVNSNTAVLKEFITAEELLSSISFALEYIADAGSVKTD